MRPWLRNSVWSAAVVVSGAVGWHYGIGMGAWTIATISAQNAAHDAFSDTMRALALLQGPEAGADRKAHQSSLQIALFRLGGASMSLNAWSCNDSETQALADAKQLLDHDPDLQEFWSAQLTMAFDLCDAEKLPLAWADYYSEPANAQMEKSITPK